MSRKSDLERARELGMTLDQFQELVGHDPLDSHTEFLSAGVVVPTNTRQRDDEDDVKLKKNKKNKKKDDKKGYADHNPDNYSEIPSEYVTFQTDEDVKNKNAREMEHWWDRPIESDADKALYYGYHVHSKDNMYGLHAHYPGGPLGGGHKHNAQNPQGYHTHRYSQEELLQFKFSRPGVMIQLDGPHKHECNAPDGKHVHCEENFGPASDQRAQNVANRNAKVDKNVISTHPTKE